MTKLPTDDGPVRAVPRPEVTFGPNGCVRTVGDPLAQGCFGCAGLLALFCLAPAWLVDLLADLMTQPGWLPRLLAGARVVVAAAALILAVVLLGGALRRWARPRCSRAALFLDRLVVVDTDDDAVVVFLRDVQVFDDARAGFVRVVAEDEQRGRLVVTVPTTDEERRTALLAALAAAGAARDERQTPARREPTAVLLSTRGERGAAVLREDRIEVSLARPDQGPGCWRAVGWDDVVGWQDWPPGGVVLRVRRDLPRRAWYDVVPTSTPEERAAVEALLVRRGVPCVPVEKVAPPQRLSARKLAVFRGLSPAVAQLVDPGALTALVVLLGLLTIIAAGAYPWRGPVTLAGALALLVVLGAAAIFAARWVRLRAGRVELFERWLVVDGEVSRKVWLHEVSSFDDGSNDFVRVHLREGPVVIVPTREGAPRAKLLAALLSAGAVRAGGGA